jgi:excisionase family DNA binding protein
MRRTNRLTVGQAAAHLGISEGAVRNRIKRGTLRAHREAGRVYVLVAGAANRDESHGESQLVAVLREQLAAERQAHAESRRLLMAALERIPPQIEPPRDERESPSTAEEASEGAEPRPDTPGAQEGVQRRSWWRRILRG